KFAPRYEATVASLEHNDYLTHGAIHAALMGTKTADAGKGAALRASYDRVCQHILQFLNATLKQQQEAREFLQQSCNAKSGDDQFRLLFRSPIPAPPTARQLLQFLWTSGPEKAAELLRSCRDDVDITATLGGARFALIDFDGTVKVDEKQIKQGVAFFKL